MNNISAIILTNNSEELIADCIDSVSFCQEIIVIDDESTDRTLDLARHLGARVYKYKSQSFAEKRNFGLEKAKYSWILYIDDDERVSKELQQSIRDVVSDIKGNDNSAYRIRRKNFYLGKNAWPNIEKMERFFKKSSLMRWEGKLHETAIVKGEVAELEGFLYHYSHQDLSSMLRKTIKWSEIEAKLRFNSHHPRMNNLRFLRVMVTGFYDSYLKQKGYKAGTMGLIESIYQSFSMFNTYVRLWEMQNDSKK